MNNFLQNSNDEHENIVLQSEMLPSKQLVEREKIQEEVFAMDRVFLELQLKRAAKAPWGMSLFLFSIGTFASTSSAAYFTYPDLSKIVTNSQIMTFSFWLVSSTILAVIAIISAYIWRKERENTPSKIMSEIDKLYNKKVSDVYETMNKFGQRVSIKVLRKESLLKAQEEGEEAQEN